MSEDRDQRRRENFHRRAGLPDAPKTTILDGPLGTQLAARGVPTQSLAWSAAAIDQAPQVIEEIHREYAEAGATVHTANTFRTKRRTVGDAWKRLARRAVEIARQSVPPEHVIAGSIAPLMDCYRPDLSPGVASRAEHRELAQHLAQCGCDLLICETFPHLPEAIVAVEEAVATGLPTWLALTAGPDAHLLSPQSMADGAAQAVDAGAQAILVNCTPAVDSARFLTALADRNLDVPLGVYANAGSERDEIGWQTAPEEGAKAYLRFARQWISRGATLVGGCCGTGPEHIRGLKCEARGGRREV